MAALALRCQAPSGKLPAASLVVLVSIDTLRPDHLGCYGYARPTSPALDRWAAEGTLFEDAMSTAPWTLPAHASLLTGLYPARHGLKGHDRYLPTKIETLAQILGRRGIVTAAVVNSQNLGPRFGLDRGFREFLYVPELADQRAPSRRITDQAIEWLRRFSDTGLFLFVHYYDVHSDYTSEQRYEKEMVRPYSGLADGTTAQLMAFREGKIRLGSRDAPHLMDLYDAGIRQLDEELERLLSAVRARGIPERTLLIMTSDHGEEFFEHGGVLHGLTQFQEVLRVPLLVWGRSVPKGKRVSTPVSLLDVMPTILAALDGPAPPTLDGDDLSPLWVAPGSERLASRFLFGEADQTFELLEARVRSPLGRGVPFPGAAVVVAQANVEPDVTRAVRRGEYKLHFDRRTQRVQLYDLRNDPGELKDVAAAHPTVVAELHARLLRFLAIRGDAATLLQLTPEELEKLRGLGYVQ